MTDVADLAPLVTRWRLILAATRDARLGRTDLAVLGAVVDRINKAGQAWPSLTTIAKDSGVTPRNVPRCITRLCGCDYLRKDAGGPRKSNVYAIGGATLTQSSTALDDSTVMESSSVPSPSAVGVPSPSAHELALKITNYIEPTTKASRVSKPLSAERFSEFWKAYPRKIGDKAGALKTWAKKNLDQQADAIIQAVAKRAAGDPGWADPKFIPYPAKYLNQERWNDEWTPAPKRKPSAADSFAGKVYEGTPEDELPYFLRVAI